MVSNFKTETLQQLPHEAVENLIKRHISEQQAILCDTTMYHSQLDNYMMTKNPNDKPYWEGNLHALSDKIINIVGRYCDCHGSDMLITWDHLMSCLKTNDFDTHHFAFAVRENGVDSIGYIAANIKDDSSKLSNGYYRKIYAVEVIETENSIDKSAELQVLLKDISDISIYDIDRCYNKSKQNERISHYEHRSKI